MKEQDVVADAVMIRPCTSVDHGDMLTIINAAAGAYRGVIPADRWHEPYMSMSELVSEIGNGVMFSVCTARDQVVGVMGVQPRHNVDLIRHAYVLPAWQGRGIGSILLGHLCPRADRPILIGTWQAAEWAICFYQRHGFAQVGNEAARLLLRTYWNVPERQIVSSVVLASPALSNEAASRLAGEVQQLRSPAQIDNPS